jgi:NADH:ubiquinone oxidoreductase subunit 6 (subunit J)
LIRYSPSAHKVDESRIGWMLLKEYLLPFEIISILLTVAVIGLSMACM